MRVMQLQRASAARTLVAALTLFLAMVAPAAAKFDHWPKPADPTDWVKVPVTAPCGKTINPDAACAIPGSPNRIEVSVAFLQHPLTLAHEKGHVVAWQSIDAEERCRFNMMVGAACETAWVGSESAPGEWFADIWANCRLDWHRNRFPNRYVANYDFYPSERRLRKLCNGIAGWDDDLAPLPNF